MVVGLYLESFLAQHNTALRPKHLRPSSGRVSLTVDSEQTV